LRDNFIEIYKIPEGDITVGGVVEEFLKGSLERITQPTHSSDEEIKDN
jgi:predicted Fe-Mo cluster-binding NifX family protein